MSTPGMLKLLKAKGYKLTVQRQQIIEALRHTGSMASARDVRAVLGKVNPTISMDTIYRNLRLLTEIGVVHQISLQSGTVYELADDKHHHHLVCIGCEKVVCIPYCPEPLGYTEQANAEGFQVLGHSFEVYGRCAACSKLK